MSDMQAPVTLPDGTVVENPLVATNALLRTIRIVATKAAGVESAGEAKDFGAAALAMAQAIITLDPSRLAGGDTPQARKDSQPDPTPAKPPMRDGNRNGVIGA